VLHALPSVGTTQEIVCGLWDETAVQMLDAPTGRQNTSTGRMSSVPVESQVSVNPPHSRVMVLMVGSHFWPIPTPAGHARPMVESGPSLPTSATTCSRLRMAPGTTWAAEPGTPAGGVTTTACSVAEDPVCSPGSSTRAQADMAAAKAMTPNIIPIDCSNNANA